jgi:hypothetical protein
MSREAHTPGPWELGDPGRDPAAEKTVRTLYSGATILGELDVWLGSFANESEANARLIAAAPDHALICWAMCVQDARWEEWADGKGEFCFAGLRHSTKLDEFGAPILTNGLRALLTADRARSAAIAKAKATGAGK